MNRKPRVAFVVVSILVVVIAVISIVVRLTLAEARGGQEAISDFEGLSTALSEVREPGDLADPGLRIRLGRHYAASQRLLLALVVERGSGLRWRIPDRSPYLPASENEAPEPRVSHPDRSTLLLEAPLRGDRSGRLVLEALYVVIPQASVYLAFRDAALGTGLWLLLALVLWLAFGRGSLDEDSWRIGGRPAYGASAAGPAGEIMGLVGSTAGIQGAGSDPYSEAAGSEQAQGRPEGLFSPLSGLGWESYLLDRLDAELSRSASFEQDLSLLLVRFEGLEQGDTTYALMAKTIAGFFSFKDLAFERGSDGFAVILPNLDADHGLRMAEEFHKKVTFLIREEGYSEPLDALPLFIGLSSRAGRLVEAPRILGEAEMALARARDEGDTRILAFKPDPDKYRLYLASKGI